MIRISTMEEAKTLFRFLESTNKRMKWITEYEFDRIEEVPYLNTIFYNTLSSHDIYGAAFNAKGGNTGIKQEWFLYEELDRYWYIEGMPEIRMKDWLNLKVDVVEIKEEKDYYKWLAGNRL